MIRALIAMLAGLGLGALIYVVDNATLTDVAIAIEPLGTLWTNAIRMTVIPLVVSLIIVGIARQTQLLNVGRLGARCVVVFLALLAGAGLLAVAAAPFLLSGISASPGVAGSPVAGATAPATVLPTVVPTLTQRLLEIVPVNPIKAAADGALLSLAVFSLIFGAALTRLESAKREPVVRLFESISDAMLIVVKWVLAAAPVGVFALSLALGVRLGGSVAGALLQYVLVLSALMLVYTLILYPVACVFGRVPVRDFANAAIPAQIIAFSSRSSLAALPALVTGAREQLRAPAEISGFILPLSVSLLRLSVPISWVVGVLFLGRIYNIEITAVEMMTVMVTAVLLSFSVPGIPSGSLFILSPMLADLGIPAEGVGILMAVDAIPDMFKTTVNVTGHAAAAAILTKNAR